MKREDIVKAIVDRTGMNKNTASIVVTTVFDEMVNALLRQEEITIRGLGTFSTKKLSQRTAYNFQTKETHTTYGRIAVKFKAANSLNRLVNLSRVREQRKK